MKTTLPARSRVENLNDLENAFSELDKVLPYLKGNDRQKVLEAKEMVHEAFKSQFKLWKNKA